MDVYVLNLCVTPLRPPPPHPAWLLHRSKPQHHQDVFGRRHEPEVVIIDSNFGNQQYEASKINTNNQKRWEPLPDPDSAADQRCDSLLFIRN